MRRAARLTGALRTKRLVGRTGELKTIRKAIWATGELRVLDIVGDAGIGKTRLLEEIPRLASEFQLATGQPCICSDILDFYQSAIHSRHGLQLRLMETLDPQRASFGAYRLASGAFDRLQAAGSDPKRIDEERQRLEGLFADGFNEISARSRVVLVFDTVELIQYESDLIQQICRIREVTGLEVKDWLLDNIPRFRNTVVILAGREKAQLATDLKQHFGDRLTSLDLGPLEEADTLDYFAAVAEVQPRFCTMGLSVDQQRVIHRYTAGLPMKLAFVVDLLTREVSLPEELYAPLEVVRTQGKHELTAATAKVEAALVAGIMTTARDVDAVLPYVALARKGMNRELLERITEWPSSRCSRVLQDLRRFSFAKVRPGSSWLFLHDEMYDLLERYAWNRMEVEREQICQTILAYYDELLTRATTRSREQNLKLDRMYYLFVANPRHGYEEYARLSEEALLCHDAGFDIRLRDEMLQFCARYPARVKWCRLDKVFIEYDAAVRWVKRYVLRGKYTEAIEVAETIAIDPRVERRGTPSFNLAQSEMDVYRGLALIYTGRVESGVRRLRALIADLEGASAPDELAQYRAGDAFDVWRRNLALGRAHDNLGYVYRTRLGRYRAALQEYRRALPYFRAANLEEWIANASDGMGRAYALLGDRVAAEILVNEGLSLRRRLGYKYRIGLSLISRAIVHLQFGEPHRAHRVAIQALRIFERIGVPRGRGLAHITMGQSLRQLGTLWRASIYTPEACEKLLNESITHLKEATSIFPQLVNEPIRPIESYNELGCAYRGRAALLESMKPGWSQIDRERDEAVRYLNEALVRADKGSVFYADSCEDLAEVYLQAHEYAEAEDWLKKAEAAIPGDYKVTRRGLTETQSEESTEEFWRQMGKIEVLRGHLIFSRGRRDGEGVSRSDLEEALEHYALAAVYFERYSGRVEGLRTILEEMYGNLVRCKRDDLQYARDQVLRKLASDYSLDLSYLYRFFEDTLGLALLFAP